MSTYLVVRADFPYIMFIIFLILLRTLFHFRGFLVAVFFRVRAISASILTDQPLMRPLGPAVLVGELESIQHVTSQGVLVRILPIPRPLLGLGLEFI